MKTSPPRRTRAAGLLATLFLSACGAPAATQTPPSVPAPATNGAGETARHQDPDVRFMQEMIVHHAQAVEMTALVPTRAGSENVRRMAERISVSQKDESAMMERWLREHGAEVPGPHAHHEGHAGMPGMATPEEMAHLATLSGPEFDRLFLTLMIRHHEGALVMVEQLFAAGGGQRTDVFRLASDVDADQRAEIARMQRLLNGTP